MSTPQYPSWPPEEPEHRPTLPEVPQEPPPPSYPPPYPGYPGYYAAYPPAPPTNGMVVASLVLGILWIYWVGSLLALVFGYLARAQIRQRGEQGDGMAVAGIVLGWIGVGVLLTILLIVGLVTAFRYR